MLLLGKEIEGQASRVEVYACGIDGHLTSFPRYNSARTLLRTRSGRCGEYANLFGLYCRALGLQTRYILDWTDHVWTEVWVQVSRFGRAYSRAGPRLGVRRRDRPHSLRDLLQPLILLGLGHD